MSEKDEAWWAGKVDQLQRQLTDERKLHAEIESGLYSQNESLRRELDRINQHVKEMLERQAEKEKYDHFPFTPKNWPT